jgi:DNA-binding MarR family transcriptional regulator
MARATINQPYDEQIALMIEDFVQMWIKFEKMLHTQLSGTHSLNSPGSVGFKQGDGNYGLFYRVSNVIHPRNQITMGELSSNLSVSLSKATRIVNWLVSAGYLQRSHDLEDRRVVRVALTQNGEELHQAIGNYVNKSVGQLLLSSLTREQKTVLFTLINKVASVLKTMAS